MENLHNKRQVYNKFRLLETEIKKNPMEQFRDWYHEAEENCQNTEVNVMSVSTIEEDNCPRTRMVLLKEYTWEGFIFYTNYRSRKGMALEKNNKACLHFFWPQIERQVIIKAILEKVSDNLNDGYFSVRPRGSQLGAWASAQSEVISGSDFLERRYLDFENEFQGREIPRPENWGGYMAKPYEIEFWQGRPNRLHDRILYSLDDQFNWKIERLAP